MPLYEHVFLARQDISQQQVDSLTAEFKQILEEGGGKVAKTEYWGVKSLAYKIAKNRKAHYSLMNIEAPATAVAELERRMGLSTDVLRFITVRVDAHETEPSVQMRKSDRDERGDRGDRGGFRGDRGPRGGGGGGFRGDRDRGGEGGSTYRARPPREGGDRPPREGGDRPPRDFGDRPPRAPRPPRDSNPTSGA
ncbi:MAG: 30S ribosomal protein S6 [Hyphomicrobiaceae bacterium]